MKILDGLDKVFAERCENVIEECESLGIIMRPFCGLRTPYEQAILWRQSRSKSQIDSKLESLKRNGLTFIYDAIISAGVQHGRWATNAIPGESWHQYGLALDCVLMEDNKEVWDGTHPSYKKYAEIAKKHGLTAGYFWYNHADPVHVQMHNVSPILYYISHRKMEESLIKRWGML